MKCPRCNTRHRWSWTPDGTYDSEWDECHDDDGDADIPSEGIAPDPFHCAVDTMTRCKVCGTTEFQVGHAPYHTFIRCPNCGWEDTVHEG